MNVENLAMLMLVMQIWRMRMAVFALRHGLMCMRVVTVIMSMSMLVIERVMSMLVAMVFCQMQPHAQQHQAACE